MVSISVYNISEFPIQYQYYISSIENQWKRTKLRAQFLTENNKYIKKKNQISFRYQIGLMAKWARPAIPSTTVVGSNLAGEGLFRSTPRRAILAW